MILRRLMRHFKSQNWFAVGLDMLVVIVGIFLGMQVTDWNEERKNSATSDYIHQKLKEDFLAIKEQAIFRVEFHKERTADLQYFLKVLRNEVPEPYDKEKINNALSIGDMNWENPRHSAVWNSLIANNQMELVTEEQLRQALAEYERGLSESEKGYLGLRTMMTAVQPQFLQFTEFSPDFDMEDYLKKGNYIVPIRPYDLSKMKASPDFHRAISMYMRLQFYMMLNHNLNLENADKVLAFLTKY